MNARKAGSVLGGAVAILICVIATLIWLVAGLFTDAAWITFAVVAFLLATVVARSFAGHGRISPGQATAVATVGGLALILLFAWIS